MKRHLLAAFVLLWGTGTHVSAQEADVELKEAAVELLFLSNRQWLYPKCGTPAKELVVFDLEKRRLNGRDRTLLASLQGLVNKSRPPELYLIHGRNWRHWLNYLQERSWIKGYTDGSSE